MCVQCFLVHAAQRLPHFPTAFHPQLVGRSVLLYLFSDAHLFVCLYYGVWFVQVQHTRRSTKLCETSCWMLLWQFLCCPQILVAGILCCLPEQHWEKGWLALGNTGLPGALLKLTFLDANFPALPSVQFYDLNSLIYSLLLSQFNIGDYFYSNCGENKKWGVKGWGMRGNKWEMWKMLGLQVPGTNLCVCVHITMQSKEAWSLL